jgi:hypothetical protein
VSNKLLELITAGQELIRDPAHWTQGIYARNSAGEAVGMLSDRAFCFCSIGALHRAQHNLDLEYELIDQAHEILDKATGEIESVVKANDSNSHDYVMGMWDRAKELASA